MTRIFFGRDDKLIYNFFDKINYWLKNGKIVLIVTDYPNFIRNKFKKYYQTGVLKVLSYENVFNVDETFDKIRGISPDYFIYDFCDLKDKLGVDDLFSIGNINRKLVERYYFFEECYFFKKNSLHLFLSLVTNNINYSVVQKILLYLDNIKISQDFGDLMRILRIIDSPNTKLYDINKQQSSKIIILDDFISFFKTNNKL